MGVLVKSNCLIAAFFGADAHHFNDRDHENLAIADFSGTSGFNYGVHGGRHLIVGPGCVLPINTPPENITAVLQAVRGE